MSDSDLINKVNQLTPEQVLSHLKDKGVKCGACGSTEFLVYPESKVGENRVQILSRPVVKEIRQDKFMEMLENGLFSPEIPYICMNCGTVHSLMAVAVSAHIMGLD